MSSPVSRRTFMKQVSAGGAALGLDGWRASPPPADPVRRQPDVLSGTKLSLRIGATPVNLTGRPRVAWTINGTLPGPTLRLREGDTVTLRVHNALTEDTSLHWHGIVLPANMDGVPGLSFHGIRPGEHYDYRFTLKQSGTYWYHSHSGFQEQRGVYGALIVEPREPEAIRYDREYVVLLSDWTDEDPARVFRILKKDAGYYNFRQRTLIDFFRDVRRNGWQPTMADRHAWARMRMSAGDLADVTGATYTYLMNGLAPSANWTGLFTPGERVRLRFINGSAMTYFDVRIPGLKLTVVAADGLPVRPVTVDEFRMAVAETFDVLVEPAGRDAFTIVAQAMDRTGLAAGTLAVRAGLRAPVPPLDPRPVLTMADMGHHGPGPGDGEGTDHSAHGAAGAGADPHAGHAAPPAGEPPGQPVGPVSPAGPYPHPPSERGNPLVDMQAVAPAPKLDDPGIGLRANGRRVLTYADLQSAFADPDGREPGRTIELHLTGHMARFAWSFDGVKYSAAEPIRLTYGERLRLVLVNDTMMTHPVHLHGMWSDLEDEHGQFLVRKHTIDMPPGSRRTIRVTADALGRWALHCHLLYHMEAGMMREVRVEE